METIETLTGQILTTLGTMGSAQPATATPTQQPENYRDKMRLASEQFKRTWLRRLNLDHHHPDLIKLEDGVWEFCRGIAMTPRKGKRYVCYGNNGTGKSKSAKAVSRWVGERATDLPLVDADEGVRTADCVFVNWAERVDWIYSGKFDIDDMLGATVLILDDIGAEHDPKKIGQEKLYLILEKREFKWTWINTNLPPGSWWDGRRPELSRFDRRIADRLMRNSVLIDLSNVPSYSDRT